MQRFGCAQLMCCFPSLRCCSMACSSHLQVPHFVLPDGVADAHQLHATAHASLQNNMLFHMSVTHCDKHHVALPVACILPVACRATHQPAPFAQVLLRHMRTYGMRHLFILHCALQSVLPATFTLLVGLPTSSGLLPSATADTTMAWPVPLGTAWKRRQLRASAVGMSTLHITHSRHVNV